LQRALKEEKETAVAAVPRDFRDLPANEKMVPVISRDSRPTRAAQRSESVTISRRKAETQTQALSKGEIWEGIATACRGDHQPTRRVRSCSGREAGTSFGRESGAELLRLTGVEDGGEFALRMGVRGGGGMRGRLGRVKKEKVFGFVGGDNVGVTNGIGGTKSIEGERERGEGDGVGERGSRDGAKETKGN
jgi:hypothetical protein